MEVTGAVERLGLAPTVASALSFPLETPSQMATPPVSNPMAITAKARMGTSRPRATVWLIMSGTLRCGPQVGSFVGRWPVH